MKEIITDQWQMLLPEEWFAEQDDETIIVSDEDSVSAIEITTLFPQKGSSTIALIDELLEGRDKFKTALAGIDAFYQEMEDDGSFWREWFCFTEEFVIAISHGVEDEHRGMDDSAVDEILSTLILIGEGDEAEQN